MLRPFAPTPSTAGRFAAALTLLAFLIASLGLLPSPAWVWARLPALRDHPCAGHGCGCSSLDACWTNCRCLSRTERLAWTIRHRAAVPSFIRPTDAEWRLAGAIAAGAAQPPGPDCPLCETHADPQAPPSDGPALSALGCQGVFPWITIPGIPADPSAPSPLTELDAVIGHITHATIAGPDSRTLEAPTPPPRAA